MEKQGVEPLTEQEERRLSEIFDKRNYPESALDEAIKHFLQEEVSRN
jgi:hypothetical protein